MKPCSDPYTKHASGRVRKFILCECPYCGAQKELRYDIYAAIDSCGCRRGQAISEGRKSHKMSFTKEYRAWASMLSRCQNNGHNSYQDYGGRGITVCSRWQKFEPFFEDMGAAPSKNHSLERIDNDKGYAPENVRWAPIEEQALNRRTSRRYCFNGEVKVISEWAKITGIYYETLRKRLVEYGWSVEKALTEPVRDTNAEGFPIKLRSALQEAQNVKT